MLTKGTRECDYHIERGLAELGRSVVVGYGVAKKRDLTGSVAP